MRTRALSLTFSLYIHIYIIQLLQLGKRLTTSDFFACMSIHTYGYVSHIHPHDNISSCWSWVDGSKMQSPEALLRKYTHVYIYKYIKRIRIQLLQLGKRLNTSFASHGRKGLLHPPHDWSLVEQLLRKKCVCCCLLERVAVCCRCCSVLQCVAMCCNVLQCVAVFCSALCCVAVCFSMWQCVAVCCRVLQRGAAWSSVVQRAAVFPAFCSGLQPVTR